MTAPLKTMIVTTAGEFGVKRVGSGLPDKNGVRRHIGVDLRAPLGTPFYAPEDGIISLVSTNPTTGLKIIELRGKYWHRFLHLKKFHVAAGHKVKVGELLGWTGDSGNVLAHLHWDVRKPGTAWHASFYNYYDPIKLLEEEDMYKGKPAKYWYDKYETVARQAKKVTELAEKRGEEIVKLKAGFQIQKDTLFSKIKGVFGK